MRSRWAMMRAIGDGEVRVAGPAHAVGEEDVGDRHRLAHQERAIAEGVAEARLGLREFPAQALLDGGEAHLFGQDEAVAAGHPEDGVEFVVDAVREGVLPGAVERAGGMRERAVAVGEEGHDRDRVGDRLPVDEKRRDLARGVVAAGVLRARARGDMVVGLPSSSSIQRTRRARLFTVPMTVYILSVFPAWRDG
jgi:hypothetical protein